MVRLHQKENVRIVLDRLFSKKKKNWGHNDPNKVFQNSTKISGQRQPIALCWLLMECHILCISPTIETGTP
jgi:hypothetical protein